MERVVSNTGQPDAADCGPVAPRPRWRDAALALVAGLERHGLVCHVLGHAAVLASNPAGEPDPDDPRGQAFSPGLRQEVRCRPHGADQALWWFWVWSGPTRQSRPDLEPLCPVTDAETAADRMRHVLAVPFADDTVR